MRSLSQFRLPRVLEHSDCLQLIHALDRPIYRCCLQMMYSCGLRLGEAVKIEISDIDKATGNLTVIGMVISIENGARFASKSEPLRLVK